MRNMQTYEAGFGLRRHLFVPVVAAAMLAAGCGKGGEEAMTGQAPINAAVSMGTTATGSVAGPTITGRIETLRGEPVEVWSRPSGGQKVLSIRDKTKVEIVCQAPGTDAPGNPADFGKPPMADTTWYLLGNLGSQQWIPQNPVFTEHPIPACPPS